METVLKAIGDWLKSLLTAGIMSNLSGLFDAVNEQVGDIAQQIGTRPSAFEPRVFAMIESLSRNVVLPIAGIILTFIACYELIEMITQHNNMAQFEPSAHRQDSSPQLRSEHNRSRQVRRQDPLRGSSAFRGPAGRRIYPVQPDQLRLRLFHAFDLHQERHPDS